MMLYDKHRDVYRTLLDGTVSRARTQREPEPSMTSNPKGSKTDVFAQLRALEQPLRARGVASLALFGSFPEAMPRPDSDVDVLVEVVAEARFSLVDLVAEKDFLEDQLGWPVDVLMKEGLEPLIRDRVLRDSVPCFDIEAPGA
jgi:uncharacterized protein